MEYINLLDGEMVKFMVRLGFVTILIMAIIEISYRVEMMGEDEE